MKERSPNLTHKIDITINLSDGTTPEDWQPFITLWANKKGLEVKRVFFEAAAIQSENDVVFTVHFKSGIRSGMRIYDNLDKVSYEIYKDPVDPYDNRKWLKVYARRITQNGN